MNVTSTNPNNGLIEYQFSVNDSIEQVWSDSCDFDLTSLLSDSGLYTVAIELREVGANMEPIIGVVEYYVYRVPIALPTRGEEEL